jgi:hypothetical protein
MTHTRGRPYHPQTQGKIERWHRPMKNQVLLENYYSPSELKSRIGINHAVKFGHYRSLCNFFKLSTNQSLFATLSSMLTIGPMVPAAPLVNEVKLDRMRLISPVICSTSPLN